MHKWTIRDNWQWYGWWRCDDFISIFGIRIRANDICELWCWPMGHTWHTCLDGDTCHTLSAHLAPRVTHCHGPTSKNFLPPGPAKWFLHPWRLLTPLPSHELWQYPDIIYLTKANNRSTLQSNWESERGTREFNNWFNASPHIKAKDFAKRWGQKQPVHFIICQTAPAADVRNEKFLTKRAKLLSAVKLERRAGEWKLSNFAFLFCWF